MSLIWLASVGERFAFFRRVPKVNVGEHEYVIIATPLPHNYGNLVSIIFAFVIYDY